MQNGLLLFCLQSEPSLSALIWGLEKRQGTGPGALRSLEQHTEAQELEGHGKHSKWKTCKPLETNFPASSRGVGTTVLSHRMQPLGDGKGSTSAGAGRGWRALRSEGGLRLRHRGRRGAACGPLMPAQLLPRVCSESSWHLIRPTAIRATNAWFSQAA